MDLSICIPCRNRSRMDWETGGVRRVLRPFLHTVLTLGPAVAGAGLDPGAVELVVADYGSTDWPLTDWIADAARPIVARVIDCPLPFTVGGGKNRAAQSAAADVLFFTETDLEVPATLLRRGMELAREGRAYFPRYQREHGPGAGLYWGSGHGCCVVRREHWAENRWLEGPGWDADEDTRFWNWFQTRGLDVREDEPAFIHRWHPLVAAKVAAEKALNG